MRIAVFASDREERYALSRLAEELLLKQGVLPEITLFPMLPELVEAWVYQKKIFDLALIAAPQEESALRTLCLCTPVILVGSREDGPGAFNVGAGYFVERPVRAEALGKAIARCGAASASRP